VVALAAPNPDAFQFKVLGSRWTHVDAPRHLFLIPPTVLVRLGEEFGLEVVLLTTLDAGTLGWNVFGWRESLAGFARGRYARYALRLLGLLAARAARPLDRRGWRGSTYTLVLRRPAVGSKKASHACDAQSSSVIAGALAAKRPPHSRT
jgi:hypothetical protein